MDLVYLLKQVPILEDILTKTIKNNKVLFPENSITYDIQTNDLNCHKYLNLKLWNNAAYNGDLTIIKC